MRPHPARSLLALLLLCALPVAATGPAAAGAAARAGTPTGTRLSAGDAVRMMRTVLVREFGDAWRDARGHRLSCPVAVHPRRGGAVQQSEIRRRCFFSWQADGTAYEGHGLIWSRQRNQPDTGREWLFQFFCTERRGSRVDHFNQSGGVHPGPVSPRSAGAGPPA
ncbi:MAG: hypothetical protein U0R71_10225 [Solirubrobacterales bacterium]